MMVIAFFSILIVCMGFMTQYSWHPAKEDDPDEDIGSKLVKRASQKLVTTPLGRQLSARASDKFPRLSNSLRDLQLSVDMANQEMNEGGGDGNNEAQPPPPNDPPPPQEAPPTTDGDGLGTNDLTTPDNVGGGGGDLELPTMEASAPMDDNEQGGDVL